MIASHYSSSAISKHHSNHSSPMKARLFSPIESSAQNITLMADPLEKGFEAFPSPDNTKDFSSLPSYSNYQLENEKSNHTVRHIAIDQQKDVEEVQELIDLLERGNAWQCEKKPNRYKAIYESKQTKIDIIPEEDEEKLKTRSKLFISKEKKKMLMSKLNRKTTNRTIHRKMQIDVNSNKEVSINQPQLSTHSKLKQEKERKEIADLLSLYSQKENVKKFKLREASIESHSISGLTQDSMKNRIHANNSFDDYSKDYFRIKRQLTSAKMVQLPKMVINRPLPEAVTRRPLSNVYSPSFPLKGSVGNEFNCDQRAIDSRSSDKVNFQEIAQGDKKRSKLGSAPCKEYVIKDQTVFVRNRLSSVRPLHQIKIERGLASSRFINNLEKKIAQEYHYHLPIENKTFLKNNLIKIKKI